MVNRERNGQSCFRRCGDHFAPLFRAADPAWEHDGYTVQEYAPAAAVVNKLDAVGFDAAPR